MNPLSKTIWLNILVLTLLIGGNIGSVAAHIEPSMYPQCCDSSVPVNDDQETGDASKTDFPLIQTDTYSVYLPSLNSTVASYPIPDAGPGWSMVAGNVFRTSWVPEEVTGNIHVEWYRNIEAFISPKVQIIATEGLIYLSTARGLIVLNSENGSLVWRFDTEMPLGNSPTVIDGVAYVGGFDRKLHALDALTGAHLWSYDGANAGYDTNPLVIEGKVILGNRDGYMYAIGAHGTPQQGRLVWRYKAGGPIHLSAAYKDGVVYFASDDNYAYALRADNGSLVWKSGKLPGDGYHSYWPVIYRDMVIFSGASPYRVSNVPGITSVTSRDGTVYNKFLDLDKDGLWPSEPDGTLIGNQVNDQTWSNGYPVLDGSRITEYMENNPAPDPVRHKPWRRLVTALNLNNGSEFTFDSDGDGYQEYIPFTMWGTHSGNRYPPIVGVDNILYSGNSYQKLYIHQGRVMGWNPATPSYLSVISRYPSAIDEPYSISAGGDVIYRMMGDYIGEWFSVMDPARNGNLFTGEGNTLMDLAPDHDEMIYYNGDGFYFSVYGSPNGIYHPRGDETVLVPYNSRLFVHRNNSIIALGSGPQLGKLATIPINEANDSISSPTESELVTRLEEQVQKILDAGLLRPGYLNNGIFYDEFIDYFENPGETLYTLSLAYPHLSPETQQELRSYLRTVFQTYFDPVMFTAIGWADGAPRESLPMPPEVAASIENLEAEEYSRSRFTWFYPPQNFYAMWKYAEIFPQDVSAIYELAKGKLQVPVPYLATDDWILEQTWELNAYIAGYIGFLELQDMAGMSGVDSQLRTQVTNELNRLKQLRVNEFEKDSPWLGDNYVQRRHMNIARNFIYLVPELGEYMNQQIPTEVREALAEYDYIAPFWFVTKFESVHNEGIISNLYNYVSLFQAKALILGETRQELTKYLDAPAFEVGDLFYIQNLALAINAP